MAVRRGGDGPHIPNLLCHSCLKTLYAPAPCLPAPPCLQLPVDRWVHSEHAALRCKRTLGFQVLSVRLGCLCAVPCSYTTVTGTSLWPQLSQGWVGGDMTVATALPDQQVLTLTPAMLPAVTCGGQVQHHGLSLAELASPAHSPLPCPCGLVGMDHCGLCHARPATHVP